MLMEVSLPALWASVAGWCTPIVLFVVINVIIGTIFFFSSLARSSGEPKGGHDLARTASVLPRLKSLNHLFRQRTEETRAIAALLAPEPDADAGTAEKVQEKEEGHLGRSVSEQPKKVIKAEKMKEEPDADAGTAEKVQEKEGHLGRSVSEQPKKVIKAEKMKKSASSKPLTSSKMVEEEDVVRWPSTARAAPAKEDDGVDAKADDFINQFKQQLKLQRLDSIIRYKEMISRGE